MAASVGKNSSLLRIGHSSLHRVLLSGETKLTQLQLRVSLFSGEKRRKEGDETRVQVGEAEARERRDERAESEPGRPHLVMKTSSVVRLVLVLFVSNKEWKTYFGLVSVETTGK